MCFGVYICIFKLCFMFIAANIVCCRLRHQDARCPTVSSINSLLTILQSFAFFCAHFYVWGAPTVRFAPVVPWAKAGRGPRSFSCSQMCFKTVNCINYTQVYGRCAGVLCVRTALFLWWMALSGATAFPGLSSRNWKWPNGGVRDPSCSSSRHALVLSVY
jgi:hypothetical protein